MQTAIVGSTPMYSAPEALFDKVSSSKSDVYSFAIVRLLSVGSSLSCSYMR
jgi:serine/threonine protein kinase